MNYIMRGGALYLGDRLTARIKGVFTGPEKSIFSPDGLLLLQTDIRNLNAPRERLGDVRFRRYVLLDPAGQGVACGEPGYAEGGDPADCGWPVSRMPRVDHARVSMGGSGYRLTMRDSQHYRLERQSGPAALRLAHRGLTGGWDIDADDAFSPAVICGIFVLCRYLEQENEFMVI